MMMRRTAAIFVACAAFLTGFSFTAAAAAELPVCATKPHYSGVAEHRSPGRWVYTFQVAWCVEDGAVKWIEPIVGYEILDPACSFVGSMEEWKKPVGDGKDWHVFNMSEFVCENPDGSETYDNPWFIVGISQDGGSSVIDGGIA